VTVRVSNRAGSASASFAVHVATLETERLALESRLGSQSRSLLNSASGVIGERLLGV